VVVKAWLVFSAGLSCSCVSDQAPAPLYSASQQPSSPDEVATLHGDVGEVDGKFVSDHGGSFALLPGCHVVRVVESWGRMDPQSGGVVVKVPRLLYALPMQGGHRYVVRIQTDLSGSSVNISASEEDSAGNVTRQFPPADEQAIASCRGQ
jgi:hypothetical protein